MARLFVTERELNFFSDITKELMKDINDQKIYYFPVSEINTKVHPVYGESSEKIYDNPIEIEALVGQPENTTTTNQFGPENRSKLEVFLHERDLVDKGIKISIGDFIGYGSIKYEIATMEIMGNIYGQVENSNGFKLGCIQARESQFVGPQLGPSNIKYKDEGAVQKEFVQQRGITRVGEVNTHDVRDLRRTEVLEEPLTGPRKVADVYKPTAAGFYGEDDE